MTRATLLALASRVEAATGADRELDAAIDCAVRLPDLRPAQPDDFDGKYGYSAGNIKCEHGFLMSYRYTASLDDAMSLVPSGWNIATAAGQNDNGTWFSELRRGYRTSYDAVALSSLKCATPALALTAAAIRALAQETPE